MSQIVANDVELHEHIDRANTPDKVPDKDIGLRDLNDKGLAKATYGGTVDNLPPGYFRSFGFVGTVVAVSMSYLSLAFGFFLPVNVLSIINEDLGPDASYVWIAIIWNVTQACSFVLVGRLSDLFGRRWFFTGANAIGLIGAVVASTAQTLPTIIVGSALLGIAGAAQLSFPMVLAELVQNRHRGIALACIQVSALPVGAFGPVIIRGFITNTSVGWRWSYIICAMTSTLSVILFYLCYHPPTYDMLHTRRERSIPMWKMVDFLGAILFMAGLLITLLGVSWGGSVYPWSSARVIGFIVGGCAILIIFVLWEIYGAGDYPLVPMKIFGNRAFVGVILTAAIGTMVNYSLLVLWPVQVTVLYATTSMDVAWKSCIILSGTIVGQALCGCFIKVLGKQKLQMVFCVSVLTAFTGAMAATTPTTPVMAVVFIVIECIALGYMEDVAYTIAPFCLGEEDLGISIGILGATRSALSSTAQAVFIAILNNKLLVNIPKYVIPAAVAAGLPETSIGSLLQGLSAGEFKAVPGITEHVIIAAVNGNKEAYSESFRVVYLASLALGLCGIIAALNTPNSESKFTNSIARKLRVKSLDKDVKDADEV